METEIGSVGGGEGGFEKASVSEATANGFENAMGIDDEGTAIFFAEEIAGEVMGTSCEGTAIGACVGRATCLACVMAGYGHTSPAAR